MAETPLVILALATCGALTLFILGRAVRDVLFRHENRNREVES